MRFWKIIWEWKLWQLNLRIAILKNYLRMKALTIKFQNWDFGILFENGENVFEDIFKKKIWILENVFLKNLSLENLEKLFENRI